MHRASTVALGVGLFVAGMAFDRLALQPRPAATSPVKTESAAAAPAPLTTGTSTASSTSVTAPAVREVAHAPTKDTHESSAPPQPRERGDIAIERPRNEYAILPAASEDKLVNLARNSFAVLRDPVRRVNLDGSVDVSGKNEDGKDEYQHYNPKGELTREGWTDKATGENVHRVYFESGELRATSWVRADKSLTALNFTQSGLYENRYDRQADGTTYSTNYDDSGQVSTVWKTQPGGGTATQVFPKP